VLLIELNAWEDECLVAIEVLYIHIKKSNKATKKMKKKKNDLVCGQYTICKWVTLFKP
jgi:hypothetical protein